MKPRHSKYDREPELHEIYERLLARFDEDAEKDLFPKIDHIDNFIQLFRLQGKLWFGLYEAGPWTLIRFVFGGTEKAFQMNEITAEFSHGAFTEFLDRVSKALAQPDTVKQELIPESLKLKAVPMILANRCFRVAFACMMHYKVSIQSLIAEARSGQREAFLDLVSLDSVFLFSDYGQSYLIEAELRADMDFKNDLADALAYNPAIWSLKNKRSHYAFLILWMLDDFAYRPDGEWAQFLSDHGFDKWADEGNVRRNRERYNLPKLKR